jgi:formamidopyrimidine-DNA glycosylase
MIELPEAVVIAGQVREMLKGKVIKTATRGNTPSKFTFYSGTPEYYAATMPGKAIGSVVADGGLIVIDLLEGKNCNWHLVLGGGGERIIYHESAATLPKKHQLLLELTDGSFLTVSVQGWGAAQLFAHADACKRWCGFDKGLMPTDKGFTEAYFRGLFTGLAPGDKRSLKEFIITKPGVRGVGNGYLQDILYRAGLHARVRASELSPRQQKQLHKAIVTTISKAIEQHGRSDELDLLGQPGKYVRILSGKTLGQPCSKCKTSIEKEAFLGGAVYWCPECQPKPAPTRSRPVSGT